MAGTGGVMGAVKTVAGQGAALTATAATGATALGTVAQMQTLAVENRMVQMASAEIDAGNTFTKALKDHIKKGSEAATTQG
jgi:hypothetical protein